MAPSVSITNQTYLDLVCTCDGLVLSDAKIVTLYLGSYLPLFGFLTRLVAQSLRSTKFAKMFEIFYEFYIDAFLTRDTVYKYITVIMQCKMLLLSFILCFNYLCFYFKY